MKNPINAETIRHDAEKRIAEQTKVSAVYELVPDSVAAFDVFICTTSYAADVHLKVSGKRYPFDSAKPSADTVRILAAAFPPIALMSLKGTSRTFIPRAKYEAWPTSKIERVDEEYEVSPFLFEIEPADYSRTASLTWYSQTSQGILEVEVNFALADVREWLGVSEVSYSRYMGGRRVKDNRFRVSDDILTLFDGDETPVAQLASPVCWSSGSNETPGKFTLYWEPFGETLTPLEAIARIIGKSNG
jgi:hypothetical protein